MKLVKIGVFLLFAALFTLPMIKVSIVRGQSSQFPGKLPDSVDSDPNPSPFAPCIGGEAVAAFDDRSINQFFVDDDTHHADNGTFDEFETIEDGLGPTYNAQSCRECHQNTVSGAISQVNELRAGISSHGQFSNPCVLITDDNGNKQLICDRSLINDRAICPAGPLKYTLVNGQQFNHPDANIQERVDMITDTNANMIPEEQIVHSFRTSLNVLGDGLVEAVNSNTLLDIANNQPAAQRGRLVLVQVLEVNDPTFRVGRFGWKDQQASLLSFSGDAYLNEMGITNRLLSADFTNVCDELPEIGGFVEDQDNDIDVFARFMRATKAPPRNKFLANTKAASDGEDLFKAIGCAVCHVPSIVTSPVGTVINGGTFTVPQGLGCKTFHPYGDFLLHDIGTGDGIVQLTDPNGVLDQTTANIMRTAPLWGVRTRNRLMHDGESLTFTDAIRRHRNQAQAANTAFFNLSTADKNNVLTFLKSL